MTKFVFAKNIRAVLAFLTLLAPLACQERNNQASDTAPALANDSIAIWIERSKDADLSADEQAKWLKTALSKTRQRQDDSLKSEYYSQISLAYLRRSDSLNFRKTSATTMDLAAKVGDSVNIAESHWDLATFFNNYSILDSAYYHYGEAQNIFKGLNDDVLNARMLYNMALIQGKIKDYTGSEINTIRAIELLKPLESNEYLYTCYNNLGIVSKELGEYERAIEYYDQARLYGLEMDSPGFVIKTINNNKGNVYQQQGLHQRAIPFYEDALSEENLLIKDPESFARTLGNLAYSRLKSGDLGQVEDQLLMALSIRDSLNDIEGLAINHYGLADYYLTLNDTIKALDHAQKAVHYSKRSDNNKRQLLTYELLSRMDPGNAVNYANAYITLNDSLQRQERQIRDKFARIQFETDEFIAQNVLLARQRQLWIGIAIGVLLLALAIFIIVNQRARNQKLRFEQQQQAANEEIFDLMLATSQKVEEGKHDEQKRISEELHDGVLGQMNGVRMVLLGLNKKSDESSISMRSEAIEKLQEVQEEIRTISHELSDAAYQKFHNFIISIRDLVQSVSQASEIACNFTYDQDADWDDLSGEIKINLYRIVQEGLQNCVKYSYANLIKLNFEASESELKISLEDNGVGFDTKKAKKGIGHKNITSRLKKIGGNWKVESTPGMGTKLNINVPYVRSSRQKNIEKDQILEKETFD